MLNTKIPSAFLKITGGVTDGIRLFVPVPFLMVLLLSSISAFAQKNYTSEEKVQIATTVDSILQFYMDNSTFTGEVANKYDDKVVTRLRKLFSEDARIFDDVVPDYQDDGKGSPYKLLSRKRNDYFGTVLKELSNGIGVRYRRIRISYEELDRSLVKVYVQRQIEAKTKTEGYSIRNNDTLLYSLKVQPDLSIKITDVAPLGVSAFKVTNDKDQDGIIDERDECDEEKGGRALKGCPDGDGDGIADKDDNCPGQKGELKYKGCPDGWYSYPFVLSVSMGYILAKNSIQMPEANALARPYDDLDPDQSLQGTRVNNPGFTGGVSLNAHIAYYFGRKETNLKKGVSLGINLYTFDADYNYNNAVIHYRDFDGVDFYRRIITIKDAGETVRFNSINIPLMFRYRFKPTRKLGMEFSAGASYMIFFNQRSTRRVLYDAEGAYAYRGDSRFDYFPVFDPIRNDYLMLRAEDIDPDDFGNDIVASAASAYNLLGNADRNYDFGLNRLLSDNGDYYGIKTRYGYAFNGGLDFTYQLFYKVLFKTGFNVIVGRNNTHTDDREYTFITTDKDTRESSYNSIFDSDRSSTYVAFGLNAGIIVGLFNK